MAARLTCVHRFLFLVGMIVLSCPPLDAQWVQTVGAQVSRINTIVARGETIFAGTGSGVCISTDGGQHWTGWSLASAYVNSLIVKGEILIAAVWEGKNSVYLSTDNGFSWVSINTGLPSNVYVQKLATDGVQIFAGTTAHGLFVSSDNGGNWHQANLPLLINSVIGFGICDSMMFIATGGSDGVFRSTDHGQEWASANIGLPEYGIDTFTCHDSAFFAGSFSLGSIYRSTNGGGNWDRVNGLSHVHEMVSSARKLFVATWGDGVVLSENGGTTFYTVNDGLTTPYISTLSLVGNYLFAGTEIKGIWRRPLAEFVTGVEEEWKGVAVDCSLEQNYPNPCNPISVIRYRISAFGYVKLVVHDLLGRVVATLVDEAKPAGAYAVRFDGRALASGVYLYRLQVGNSAETKMLVLVH